MLHAGPWHGCTTPALVRVLCRQDFRLSAALEGFEPSQHELGRGLTAFGHHTGTPDATRAGFDLAENEFIAERTFRIFTRTPLRHSVMPSWPSS